MEQREDQNKGWLEQLRTRLKVQPKAERWRVCFDQDLLNSKIYPPLPDEEISTYVKSMNPPSLDTSDKQECVILERLCCPDCGSEGKYQLHIPEGSINFKYHPKFPKEPFNIAKEVLACQICRNTFKHEHVPTWNYEGEGTASDNVTIDGINIWQYKWKTIQGWAVLWTWRQEPEFTSVYNVVLNTIPIVFAATEIHAAGLYSFYTPDYRKRQRYDREWDHRS